MIVEKVFKCCTFGRGYGEIDSLVVELAKEIEQDYHISSIEMTPSISTNTISREPNLIITLTKLGIYNESKISK